MEISQLRSGWWLAGGNGPSWRDDGKFAGIPPSFQDGFHWDAVPDTPCLANFQLSLRDEASKTRGAGRNYFSHNHAIIGF